MNEKAEEVNKCHVLSGLEMVVFKKTKWGKAKITL